MLHRTFAALGKPSTIIDHYALVEKDVMTDKYVGQMVQTGEHGQTNTPTNKQTNVTKPQLRSR